MKICTLVFSFLFIVSVLTGCQVTEASQTEYPNKIQVITEDINTRKYAEFQKLPVAVNEPDPDGVRFQGVGFAADEAYIMVQFAAPLSHSSLWQQGYIYVVDEQSQIIYGDIPVMPVIGPLIGRPAKEGQPGYVMLINTGYGIKHGSVVSVVLGKYKREHYIIPEK